MQVSALIQDHLFPEAVVTIAHVTLAEMWRFVRIVWVQVVQVQLIPQFVTLVGVRTVKLTPQLNVLHGRKTITVLSKMALIKDVCPLMGGWGF